MTATPKTLPPSFTSAYRLFLRAASASVLHHPTARTHLRRLWQPTFREAATIIHRLDASISAAEKQRCEKWMTQWGQNLGNTIDLLVTSAQRRGLPHRVTRNLAFLHQGYHKWVSKTLLKPRAWDPSPTAHSQSDAAARAKEINREQKVNRMLQFDNEAFGALEETVRMAEATSGLLLGRAEYLKRRA